MPWAVFNAAMCAVNVGVYLGLGHQPLNAAVAVFSGLGAIILAVAKP